MLRVLVVLAVLLVTRDALAFCRTTTCNEAKGECTYDDDKCPAVGNPVFWPTLPIPFALTERGTKKLDDERVRTAVIAAFEAWENVTCATGGRTTLRFQQVDDIPAEEGLGLASSDRATGDDDGTPPFGIYFRDANWNTDARALAITTLGFGIPSGKVEVARIEINTETTEFRFATAQSPTDVDFQGVLTHEVGHYIGIAHSTVEDSIMQPKYCHETDRCDTTRLKRALSADDKAAVCALYPPLTAKLPPTNDSRATTAGCNEAPGSAPGAGALVVLLAAAAAARKRRAFRAGA